MAGSRDWGMSGEPEVAARPAGHRGGAGTRHGGRLCQACGERRPRFSYRGAVRADRHHTLCFECYRAERNRLRARAALDAAAPPAMAMPRPVAAKTVTDRAALLAGIAARRRRALICARRAVDGPVPAAPSQALAS